MSRIFQFYNNNSKLGLIIYNSTQIGGFTKLWSGADLGEGSNSIALLPVDINGDNTTRIIQLYDNNGKLGMILYSPIQGSQGYGNGWQTPELVKVLDTFNFLQEM